MPDFIYHYNTRSYEGMILTTTFKTYSLTLYRIIQNSCFKNHIFRPIAT